MALLGVLVGALQDWLELGDVGVMALLGVLVGALQDWLLLDGGHLLLSLHTAESSLWVGLAAAEVDPALHGPVLLAPTPGKSILRLVLVQMPRPSDEVRGHKCH